jgi:DNA sulfur modification protein DndD
MDDLTRPGNTKIEDAIKNIMHLPIIDKSVTHLESVTKEYRTEISRIATDRLERLISEQDSKEKEIARLKKDIEELGVEILAAENHCKEIEKILLDSKEVGQLQYRRNLLQNEIYRLEHSRDDLESEIQKVINSCYPLFIEDKAKISLQIINSQVEKGKIPTGIRQQFIEELIAKKECICGRPLHENTPSLQALLLLLSSTKSTELEDTVLQLKGAIRNISSITSERMNILNIHSRNYESVVDQIEQKDREYDDLQRRIGNSKEVDLANLEKRLQAFKNDIVNYRVDISKKRNSIDENQNTIITILRLREQEERNQQSLVKLSARETLARKAADAMSTIKSRFNEETRSRIESETKEVFKNFSWKSDQFNDINLDKDFHFEVIDRWGKPSREELSAGERQMLSLSFIAALSRLSGEEAPMIMDTPFARLSGNHLENLTNNLPELIPQLILFVTDTEWTSDVKNGLEDKIGLEYNLEFQDGCSQIVEENHGR